ncbi:hypothetical protein [Gordonibacter urolithinfaciens]|uniref:hypothetical protein n=1 Tax=Gordonibacter urolithinfaciens TaxID=1335613 RepID=UPI003A945D82
MSIASTSITARKRTSQSLRSALCLLLALSLIGFMAPISRTGSVTAFAMQGEGGAPESQDAPAPDGPSDDPAAGPAAKPADNPADEPATDPSGNPATDAADKPEGDANENAPAIAPASSDDPEVRGPGDWVLDKVYGVVFGLAETVAFKALNEAVDPQDAEQLNKVLDFVDGLLGGSSGIEHECDQILQAVQDLSQQLGDLENSIDAQFNALEQTVTLNQIENQRAQIIKMSDSVYAPALTAYREFIDASKAYAEAWGTANESARREAAETKERALVAAFDKLDYEADLTTIETYGIFMGSYTNHRYLHNLDQYADEALAFDHQRYALLTAGINDVVMNLNIVAYVQRLEYDYWKAKADNAPADADLRTKAADLENNLVTNLNRIVRDINFTASEFANKDGDASWPRTDLLTLMRPYDFQTEYDFDYASSASRSFKYRLPDPNGKATTTAFYTSQAVRTAPTMPVYRAAVKGAPFLVVDGSRNLSYGEKHGDLIHGLRYWEKIPFGGMLFTSEYYGFPDQDFFNVQSTKDGVYALPADFGPLAPLVSQPSYAGSRGSLVEHLRRNGMTSIGQAPYVLMNSYVSPAPHTGALSQNHYSLFNLYRTAIPTNGDYNSAKVKLTMEDSAGDPAMLVVLARNPDKRETSRLHVANADGLAIETTDLAGNQLPADVPAGTCVKVAVTASDPVALDSLVLRNANGDELETIASSEAALLAEGSGTTMTFAFCMPYQDAYLIATPGEAMPNPLHFATDSEGTYLISTLDDLVNVSAAYEQHPAMYEHATFRLTGNIENTRRPAPAWTAPIGSEEHPFTGTFDGAGFGIGGFSMSMDVSDSPLKNITFGGLFGVIGDGGTVRNLAVYGTDFFGFTTNHVIGVLAGANHGRIENCSTGTAQTWYHAPSSGTITPEELRLLNATVRSTLAGGLVGENHGDVVNCWSGADVIASTAGGLVGRAADGSSVWNSYALGWTTDPQVLFGGLVGENRGEVVNSYSGAIGVLRPKPSTVAGTFIGSNHHDVFFGYTFAQFDQSPIGEGSVGDAEDASLAELPTATMMSQEFADMLNEQVSGDMRYWAYSADTNAGFPYLVSDPLIERTLTDGATGITLQGTIHAGAVLSLEALDEGSASHDALVRHAKEADLLGELAAAYRALLPVNGRKSGQTALGGPVTLRIPVPAAFAGSKVTVLQEHPDGMVALAAHVANGMATVQVSAVSPFAVIVDGAEVPPVAKPDAAGGGTKLAPTADSAAGLMAALGALLALAGGAAILSRRRLRSDSKRK